MIPLLRANGKLCTDKRTLFKILLFILFILFFYLFFHLKLATEIKLQANECQLFAKTKQEFIPNYSFSKGNAVLPTS